MRVPAVGSYPTRSTSHHECVGHRDLSDWLAHLRLKNRAARTLDDYERTIAALMLWSDKPVAEYTLEDLEHFVLLKYGATPGARVRLSHLKGFFTFLYENVKQLMGHTSIQTTVDLYGHLDVQDARAALSLLEIEVV